MDSWESARPMDAANPLHAAFTTRIALVGFSPLLQELLTPGLARRAEVSLADSIDELRGPVDAVLIAQPDPLATDQVREAHERLLARRIVLVTPRGESAVLYEVWPRRARLGALDTDELADALCSPEPNWESWDEGGG